MIGNKLTGTKENVTLKEGQSYEEYIISYKKADYENWAFVPINLQNCCITWDETLQIFVEDIPKEKQKLIEELGYEYDSKFAEIDYAEQQLRSALNMGRITQVYYDDQIDLFNDQYNTYSNEFDTKFDQIMGGN